MCLICVHNAAPLTHNSNSQHVYKTFGSVYDEHPQYVAECRAFQGKGHLMLDFLEYCDAVDTHIKNPAAASFQKCPFHGRSVWSLHILYCCLCERVFHIF